MIVESYKYCLKCLFLVALISTQGVFAKGMKNSQ